MLSIDKIALPDDGWIRRKQTPPPEWAERSIYIDGRTGAVPGFYSLTRFPYCRGPLEAFADPKVEEINIKWGTQLGKTTMLSALVGWVKDNDPAPTMIGCANEKAAQAHFKRIMEPFLESVPAIKRSLTNKARRRWQVVDLGDMFIFYAWPGSKATFSDRPIKYAFGNEVPLWTAPRGQEGDPVQMFLDRTKAFPHPGRKIVLEGKPTIEGECKLSRRYVLSRHHDFCIPCPRCGEYQSIRKGRSTKPGGVKWVCDYDSPEAVEQATATAYWECEHCQAKAAEDFKLLSLMRGVWRPEGCTVEKDGSLTGDPKRPPRHQGFHLNSFASSVFQMSDGARRWVSVRENPAELQAVVNGLLAETWKLKTKKTKGDDVNAHRMGYQLGKVPKPCIGLVLTADVQESSFWYVVRAWSWFGASYLVTYGIANTWAELERVRGITWEGERGELHQAFLTLIDSAYQRGTTEVYDWCRKMGPTCIPIRGAHQYTQFLTVRQDMVDTHNIPIWHIDAGHIRDQFYDVRLSKLLGQPAEWAIPNDVRGDYIRSICAWEREKVKPKQGSGKKEKPVWISNSPDYEHWADAELMQEAFALVYDMANRRPPEAKGVRENNADPNHRAWIATQRI